jgi:hypothetical protein
MLSSVRSNNENPECKGEAAAREGDLLAART